ncbi:death associated protein 1b isoform X1 [Lampris incognitus]|uniref:death associated protein 1b isoform X1 n=1 Tax=Lampris incognitus TaxID=2546036 RepID=UPI0024B55F80|nr:death associated protein 1b isoform X1 [Lampris incognitus]
MAHRSKSGVKGARLLKAGHLPAGRPGAGAPLGDVPGGFVCLRPPGCVKAGGKRVTKKTLEENSAHGSSEKETKRPDKTRSFIISNRMQSVSILLAGTLDKLSHDFPETPVSVRHSKVLPAVEKPHLPRTFLIQQPRK